MTKKLAKIGTSFGVVIDRPLLKLYNFKEMVEVLPVDGGILIRPPQAKKEELLRKSEKKS